MTETVGSRDLTRLWWLPRVSELPEAAERKTQQVGCSAQVTPVAEAQRRACAPRVPVGDRRRARRLTPARQVGKVKRLPRGCPAVR